MMFEAEEEAFEKKQYVKIEVEGHDKPRWAELRSKLVNVILEILDLKINCKTGGTVEDEFKRISSNVIEYANAKLEKPSIENQKLLAEIEQILANKGKEMAEARKLNAEAEKIELDNIVFKLRIVLGAAKVLANSSEDPELLIFVKNIEELSFIFQQNKILE